MFVGWIPQTGPKSIFIVGVCGWIGGFFQEVDLPKVLYKKFNFNLEWIKNKGGGDYNSLY